MREGNRGSGRRYRGSVNEVVDTLYNLGSTTSYTDHAIIHFEASRCFVYKSATPWQLFSIGATLRYRLDCHSSRILEGVRGGGLIKFFFYFLFLISYFFFFMNRDLD